MPPRDPVFQYAYFVPSIEAAVPRWVSTVGAGPFFITRHHRTDAFSYKGAPVEADVSYAFGYTADTQIQLIEQHDDTPSIYTDMFQRGTGGHHHIALLVQDYPAQRRRLLDQGHELACELQATDVDAAYFDTRAAIGVYTEIHSDTPRIRATFGRWRDAHRTWDGVTDPLRTHVSGT